MKTPLNWISLYTPISSLLQRANIVDIAHQYSIHTAEIDGIENHSIDKVVIGKVISCEKHPESKKLSIVRVYLGEHGEETILTGAPNIAEATYVPVALVGALLGGDFVIGERMMAGMMSRGMICGADEIDLASEPDTGIMVLESLWDASLLETMIGKSLFELTFAFPGRDGESVQLPLRDTTFEIDNKFITNRPDLFGVYHNAREWGAVFDLDFTTYTPSDFPSVPAFPLHIETDRCLAYTAIRMDNIAVGTSPFGIALMMKRAGLAPKMDLVDITNLLSVEFGQPMHVFDAAKIHGSITVRLARSGETLLALNGETYTLTPEDIVIADDHGPVALAGVIGGMESAVSPETTDVIWESATFDAVSVRLSAQRHGIRTDASTRYEKSLDPLLARFASARILDYLRFLGKNTDITAMTSYLDEKQVKNITIDVSYDFINTKAGTPIAQEYIHTILTKLGFVYSHSDTMLQIVVPSWRASKDVSIKEDIAEEIIRIYGYEKIPSAPLGANTGISQKNMTKSLRDLSLDFWNGKNWNEVYNYSFTNTAKDTAIGYSDMTDAVGIQNAFNVEYTHMRRSLAVRLFENIAENMGRAETVSLFEIGRVYHKEQQYSKTIASFLEHIDPKPFGENLMIGGVTTDTDVLTLRKSLETYLFAVLGYVPPLHQPHETPVLPFLHPGISGEYREGEKVLIRFGQIHPETAGAFGVDANVLYWEGDFSCLLAHYQDREIRVQPISRYQSIPRELNFVMDESVHTGPIALDIEAYHPWISHVTVESVYRDDIKVGIGKKSVNFTFSLWSHESTISDDAALKVQNDIIQMMETRGYKIRGI